MSAFRALLVLLLFAPAAGAAELKTLKGDVIKGDVVSVSEKEIIIDTGGGKKVATPITQALALTLSEEYEKLGPDVRFTQVELTDGSQLKCSAVALKGKEARLTLLQGQIVTVPIAKLNWLLHEANVPDNVKEFREKALGKKQPRDLILVKSGKVLNPIAGTLGDADDEGKTIEFTLPTGDKRDVALDRPAALYFQRGPDAAAKPIVCRVLDTSRNLLFASEVKREADGYTVVTSAGASVKYPGDKVAKLDYSGGKIQFLSEMPPVSVKQTSTEGEGSIQKYRRDENLEGGPIRLGGVVYKTGLSLHSTTELEFNLDGEYRELKALVGIDDDVPGEDGPVVLKIYADSVEVLKWTITRKDKERVRPLNLAIKDVQKLKIVVTTDDLLDLGKHLTLAEARVTK
jgi:hypothetical protein